MFFKKLVCASGPAFWLLPSGVEWQLQPSQASGVHPAHRTWPHFHSASWQPHPCYGSSSSVTPGCPPPNSYLNFLPPFWPLGDQRSHGPPPGFTWSYAESRLSDALWPHPSSRPPGAPGHRRAQPPSFAFTQPPPSGSVQTVFPPTLLHRITGVCRFPSQSHQNKPVPLCLSLARFAS